MKTTLLSNKDILDCISVEQIMETVEEVFRSQANGKIIMPPKLHLDMSPLGKNSWMNAMPTYIETIEMAGIKWVGGFSNNPSRGLPYIKGIIVLMDPENGEFVSVMDGTDITNMRTGATAALVAKYTAISNPSKVVLIGAGMQNRWTLRFLSILYGDINIYVSDIKSEAAAAFKEQMSLELKQKINVAETNKEAVEGADLIITATQADEPLIKDDWLKSGSTAISLGSGQEFEERFVLKADKVLVDDWGQCSHRGELKKIVEGGRFTEEQIYAHIGDVVVGKLPGRLGNEERILTQLVGLGAHDIAIATVVYNKAKGNGIGYEFELFS